MPGDWTKKYSVGDALEFKKEWLNNVTDSAIAYLRDRASGGSAGGLGKIQRQGLVYVQNNSAADRKRFEVLSISGILVAPAGAGVSGAVANLPEFLNNPILGGVVPALPPGKFVILQEPIAKGCVGLACIFGTSIARISSADTSAASLDIVSGDVTRLGSSASGTADVLYASTAADPNGDYWALVRLGGGGASEFLRVLVTNDGGAYGSSTTTCNATYTVTDLYGHNLKDGTNPTSVLKTPEYNVRLANVTYTAPGSTQICMACYDLAGNLHLLIVPEGPSSTIGCDGT